MKEKQILEPIKDAEFNMFLEHDYANKLELEMLETKVGKKVQMLEKLGFGISISNIVEKYIFREGYTMNHVGHLFIDEKSLQEIYKEEEHKISQIFNIDISKIDDPSVLQRIVSDPRYKRDVEKYGVDVTVALHNATGDQRNNMKKIYGYKDVIFLLDGFESKEFKNEEFKYVSEIMYSNIPTKVFKDILTNPEVFNFSQEKAEQITNELNEKTINSSLDNKISTQGMRHLYRLRDAIEQSEYNSEIATETEIQATIKELEKILPDFQYKEYIVGKDGKIDIDKAVTFLNNWEKTRNETKLTEDLTGAANCDFEKVGEHNLSKFLILIEKANRGTHTENKELALAIAMKLRTVSGFDFIKDGEIDREKIAVVYSDICDGFDINDAIDQLEWNSNTAEGKLNRIDVAIDNDLGIRRDSRDQINLSKELATEILDRQKKDKQSAIEKVLLQEKCSPEQIVALFYEFRYEELAQNKKNFDKFGAKQLTTSTEHGIARLLEDYMKNNPEIFKDYLTERGNLSGVKIEELVKRNEFTNLQRAGISSTHKLIEQKVVEVEKNKVVDVDKSIELLCLIENIRGKSKEEISDKEKKEIFEKAAKLGKNNSLSKVIMRELIWIDKQQFKEMYTKLKEEQNKPQEVSWVRKTISDFRRGLVDLPKMMMRSNSKKSQEGVLASKINTMAKKVKEQKEKITKNVKLGELKNEDNTSTTSNLPVVKKTTIFDRIKGMFSKKKSPKEENANITQYDSDKEVNDQESGENKEHLTTAEKSDTTVTAKTGLDYLKVDTPIIKESSTVVEVNDQKQIDNPEPEEPEIGE